MDIYGGLLSRMYPPNPSANHTPPHATDAVKKAEIIMDFSTLVRTGKTKKADALITEIKKMLIEQGYKVATQKFEENSRHFCAIAASYPVAMPRQDMFEAMIQSVNDAIVNTIPPKAL